MTSLIVAHYGEIGTKGSNRAIFEGYLERAIASALTQMHGASVRKTDQRFFITVEDGHLEDAKERLSRTFGIAWYGKAVTAPLGYEKVLEASKKLLTSTSWKTFRVTTRRSNKSFSMTSQELNRRLGEDIRGSLALKVDLSHPDVTLNVDIISDRAVLYVERLRGPGGLPVGSSGRVIHFLSGGIDSPVAAWLMMKRGCRPLYLHFYVAPSPDAILVSKVMEIIRVLSRYGGRSDLVLVPFTQYQLATADMRTDFEPIVFRRFMRIVGERLASHLDLQAISTGDNLAQVASQTLTNLVCIDGGSSLPTLRPVLGYDKEEIVSLAKRVGTYEPSIREYKDCCSIVSRHPRTKMRLQDVDECAERFAFEELAERSISEGSMVTYDPENDSTSIRPLADLLSKRVAYRLRQLPAAGRVE